MTLLKVIVLSRFFLENDEIFKDYLTSFTVFLEILTKKKSSEKKSSENDPPTLDLKKKSRKSTNKKIWPKGSVDIFQDLNVRIYFYSWKILDAI